MSPAVCLATFGAAEMKVAIEAKDRNVVENCILRDCTEMEGRRWRVDAAADEDDAV